MFETHYWCEIFTRQDNKDSYPENVTMFAFLESTGLWL